MGQNWSGGDIYCHSFEQIISLDNLLCAWRGFSKGKGNKTDVQAFGLHLMDNLIELHHKLKEGTYKHCGYQHFKISDPKPRDIHKASVRDRIVHHAIYRILYPHFDKKFIADSYSCRLGKGTHKAMNRFRDFAYGASSNHTRTLWVLKCDIRKFFASIDHGVLKGVIARQVDSDTMWLLGEVIDSFHTENRLGVGLPLGNLTSQLFVNIYMNEFDQFVKNILKANYYIRYADDFVVLSRDKNWLESLVLTIASFLEEKLKLDLHPKKVSIKTFASGVDYLGWMHFPDHRVLRTTTKKRMFRNIKAKDGKREMVQSYLGMLSHGNAYKLRGE